MSSLKRDLWRLVFPLAVASFLGTPPAAASCPSGVPAEYERFFVHCVDRRSLSEKALNLVNLTSRDVGRSFALVAGVDTYPRLSGEDRFLDPAAADLDNLVRYLREVEFFDEIVLLRNEAVTDETFKYFLQAYFPRRLEAFPRSRFLFAYSGHGVQDGRRGYLLQSQARSFHDKANSINMKVLETLYEEIVDTAYQSLALINACHSGAFHKRSFGSRRLLPEGPGHHVITAGGTGELAWHDPEVGPGSIFFEKVFAGLDGRADRFPVQPDGTSGDGVITAQELQVYLRQEVQIETDQAQNPRGSDISRHGSKGSMFLLNRRRQLRGGTVEEFESSRAAMRAMGEGAGASTPAPARVFDEAMAAYEQGHEARAVELFREACGGGSAAGCTNLGNFYYQGIGELKVDREKASEFFRRGCEGGSAQGCYNLGTYYEFGVHGLGEDQGRAAALYRQACDGGHEDACGRLEGLSD